MANIFLSRPQDLQVQTRIERVQRLEDGSAALALAENPLRPAGGGQPADHGSILSAAEAVAIKGVRKANGETWVVAEGAFEPGQLIEARVDVDRRRLLSQGHTLTHTMMAGIRDVVAGYESKGADIAEDGRSIELRFRAPAPVTRELIWEIDRRTRSRVLQAIPVTIERARSMDAAAQTYERWRVDPDLHLGGKIRVVVIEGVDANPCSGSHVASTADIGPYAVHGHEARPLGLNLLRIELVPVWTYWF
jgi:alanyl-tRNA synthetase